MEIARYHNETVQLYIDLVMRNGDLTLLCAYYENRKT